MRDQAGFTLLEVLVAMSISAALMVLSAGPIRQYWYRQAIDGATDQLATHMRQTQERTVSESHPLIYGLRFPDANDADRGKYGIVRYDPNASGTQCRQIERHDLAAGFFTAEVRIQSPTFTEPSPVTGEFTACKAQITGGSNDTFMFFYPRGTATPGSLQLLQPALPATKTLTVGGITGRVSTS